MGHVSGQQPNRRQEPSPSPLLPAEPAWTITLPALPAAGAALDADRVYVPIEDAGTIALARETGAILWQIPTAASWPLGLLPPDGLVLVSASEAAAVERGTGATRWRAPLPAPPIAPPFVSADLIAIALENGTVTALRGTDGAIAWSQTVADLVAPVGLGADTANFYVTTANGRVAAIERASGDLRWTIALPGHLSPPAIGRGRLFVGSTANTFTAINASTGRIEWTWPSGMIGGDIIGAAVDDDVVFYVGLDNLLHAVNHGSGNQRWKQPTPTRPVAPPLAFDGVVVVFGVSPAIATFNAKTGAPIGTYVIPTAPGATTGSIPKGVPLIDPILRPFRVAIVVITADGRAIGLRPTGMMFRDAAPAPLTELPGRALQRDRLPSVTTTP